MARVKALHSPLERLPPCSATVYGPRCIVLCTVLGVLRAHCWVSLVHHIGCPASIMLGMTTFSFVDMSVSCHFPLSLREVSLCVDVFSPFLSFFLSLCIYSPRFPSLVCLFLFVVSLSLSLLYILVGGVRA